MVHIISSLPPPLPHLFLLYFLTVISAGGEPGWLSAWMLFPRADVAWCIIKHCMWSPVHTSITMRVLRRVLSSVVRMVNKGVAQLDNHNPTAVTHTHTSWTSLDSSLNQNSSASALAEDLTQDTFKNVCLKWLFLFLYLFLHRSLILWAHSVFLFHHFTRLLQIFCHQNIPFSSLPVLFRFTLAVSETFIWAKSSCWLTLTRRGFFT